MKKPLADDKSESVAEASVVAGTDLLGLVEAQTRAVAGSSAVGVDTPRFGIVLGAFQGLDASGDPLVTFPGSPDDRPLAARSIVSLDGHEVGGEVVLMFEGGDPRRPVVMGAIQSRPAKNVPGASVRADVDDERLMIEAQREVVIKCGEASITLTRAGKIVIRGTYVLSRSSGANRIKGASVEVN